MSLYDETLWQESGLGEPIDDEAFFRVEVGHRWAVTALRARASEAGLKLILRDLNEHLERALIAAATHRGLLHVKDLTSRSLAKIAPTLAASDESLLAATPGWHRKEWRQGWADARYALHLASLGRHDDAVRRARWAIAPLEAWLADPSSHSHVCPREELSDLLARTRSLIPPR